MSYTSSFVSLIAITVAALAAGLPLYLRYASALKLKATVVTGIFFGIIGGLLLVHAIVFFPVAQTQIYGEVAALGGCSLGWLIGMWLSPMGSGESSKFAKYWTAIGVGSGFTIKWAMDRVVDHAGWVAGHAFLSALFAVSLLVTMAAVYNSRAYGDSLTIGVRKPLPANAAMVDGCLEVHTGTTAQFYAAVTGPNDPATSWDVFPPTLGRMVGDGTFTAGDEPGTGHVTAFNIEDPTLSNAFTVRVVK